MQAVELALTGAEGPAASSGPAVHRHGRNLVIRIVEASQPALKLSFNRPGPDSEMMMMSFICPCRNNNQPNAIYPLGTFHGGLKKSTCDDATVMSIMVL